MVVPVQTVTNRIDENITIATNETIPVYRVTTVLNDPWIKKTDDGFEGALVDLLDAIATLSNFSYVIKETPTRTYGRIRYVDGEIQVNGIVGDVISREADLGVADLIISDVRSNVVSFSTPFAGTGAQILLKIPDNQARGLFVILEPFSASLWVLTLAAILFITLSTCFMEHYHQCARTGEVERDSCLQKLASSIHFKLATFLHKGPDEMTLCVSVCMLRLCWWLLSIATVIAYIASLTGYLLSTSYTKPVIPFKTFEELAGQSDINYGGWYEMALNVNDNVQRAMDRHISSKYTHYSDISEAVKRVLDKDSQFAAIVDGLNGQKIVNENCQLMLLQEQLFEIDYGIACNRDVAGQALCSHISVAIMTLREDGTLYEIMNKWWKQSRTCGKVSENDYISSSHAGITHFRSLEITDMFVVYIVLLVGILLSITATLVGRKYDGKTPDNKPDGSLDIVEGSNENKRMVNSKTDESLAVRADKDVSFLEDDTDDYPDIDAA